MRLFSPKTNYKSYTIPITTIIVSAIADIVWVLFYLFVARGNEWVACTRWLEILILCIGFFMYVFPPMLIFRSIVEIMYAKDNRKKQ